MNCDSTELINGYLYGCTKRKNHKGWHKNGFHSW